MAGLRCARLAGASTAFIAYASSALAQWTVINLHPAGADASRCWAVEDGQQVGEVLVGNRTHASVWHGAAGSWGDLNPPGSLESVAYGTSRGLHVGHALAEYNAAVWRGGADGWVNLDPGGYSVAVAIDDGRVVGALRGGGDRAALWRAPEYSLVILHPGGATTSFAYASYRGSQAGVVDSHAAIWVGTASSHVDLHPPGCDWSAVYGMSADHQVGIANGQAAMWSGTASSWVNLHPPIASWSIASDGHGLQQVGSAVVSGASRAWLWKGNASAGTDLHAFLPPEFADSRANGIWDDGLATYVVGSGRNALTGRDEALFWIGPKPCDTAVSVVSQPSTVALLPGGAAHFSVAVGGHALDYCWRRNGTPIVDDGRITGTASSALMINAVQAGDEGEYDCIIRSTCNEVRTAAALLSCDPIITEPLPLRQLLEPGLTVLVPVPAFAPYSYRWRQNGQNLFNIPGLFTGTTTSTLTFLSDDPSLEGLYDVVVTDTCGVATSSVIEVRRCFPDINLDGNVDQDDVLALIDAVGGGTSSDLVDPDFNRDGNVDQDDVVALISVVAGATCP